MSEMQYFRKKPVVIAAVQHNGDIGDLPEKIQREVLATDIDGSCFFSTLEGVMKCSVNDWIIEGVNGELYPCKPDIFEKTYEHYEK